MVVAANKRSLISSFCLSTSICSSHRCYLCLPRLRENHLYGTRNKRLHNEQSNSLSFIEFSVQFLFCKYLFLECSHQKRFYWSKKFVAKHFVDITIYLSEANDLLPWVPETFLARFPVFSRGFAARGFGQHRGTQGNDLFNRKLGIVN